MERVFGVPMIRAAVVACAWGVGSVGSLAGVTYVDALRRAEAGPATSLPGPGGGEEAVGFGPFSYADSSEGWELDWALSQESVLGPTGIAFAGTVGAGRFRAAGNWFSIYAISFAWVQFEVTVPTGFVAMASGSGSGEFGFEFILQTMDLTPTVIYSGLGSHVGVLQPGRYRSMMSVSSIGRWEVIDGIPSIGWPLIPGTGELSAWLTVPGPGVVGVLMAAGLVAGRRVRPRR